MLKLAVAALVVVAAMTSTSRADTCKDGGTSLASITRWKFTGDPKTPQRMEDKVELFDTGRWTLDVVEDKGRVLEHTEGCLAAADLATLRTTLAAADWKSIGNPVACDYASDHTDEYVIAGKHVFDPTSPCTAGIYDDVTKHAITALDALSATAHKHP